MESEQLIPEFLSLVDVENFADIYSKDIKDGSYFGMPLKCIIDTERHLRANAERCIAYFSMEYGLATGFYNKFISSRPVNPNNRSQEHEVFSNYRLADYFFTIKADTLIDLPIYSGGLGVLAGDTVKTMADYKLPAVAIGMLWNTGYFRQKFWFRYGQVPEEMRWDPASFPGLVPLKNRIKISLKSEEIHLRLWKYYVYSYARDYAVPLILLDSNVEPNSDKNRHFTEQLYKSDSIPTRMMQRVILGMGGVLALKELGYNIGIFHLNEGHAVFAFIEKARGLSRSERDELKKHFAYTCHTPVEAGHDKFQLNDLNSVLKKEDCDLIESLGKDATGAINLTLMAMNASSSINAVSLNHQKVMHLQFPKYKQAIKYVTNGVHPHTWISQKFMVLFEKYSSVLGDIKPNPYVLVRVKELRQNSQFRNDLWLAHQANKSEICTLLEKWGVDKNVFTICWARRVAAYKRPSMIFSDAQRLIDIAQRIGPIQIIFAGKAHPKDDLGFTFINEMLDKVDTLTGAYDVLKIIMLENYEITLARLLTSGVDVWLNNPLPPFEASGTSGMKAILNAVIQISTFDGWMAETENMNIGRIFGYRNEEGKIGNERDLRIKEDSRQLYGVLEEMVKLYYETNNKGKVNLNSQWLDTMIDCIAAGSKFNTYRMLDEYKKNVWNM